MWEEGRGARSSQGRLCVSPMGSPPPREESRSGKAVRSRAPTVNQWELPKGCVCACAKRSSRSWSCVENILDSLQKMDLLEERDSDTAPGRWSRGHHFKTGLKILVCSRHTADNQGTHPPQSANPLADLLCFFLDMTKEIGNLYGLKQDQENHILG